jgi:stage V sporulation protein AA
MFAMMTFNEDVSTRESFDKVYEWVMDKPAVGVTILEITYSIGVGVGIVIFFNHFGKKYITNEPSPVEVEMAGYEQQVNDALIKQVGRKGQEADVD